MRSAIFSDPYSDKKQSQTNLSCRYNCPRRKKREELLKTTDLWRHISSQHIPQFIAYGTKDGMVGMDETKNYISRAKESGCIVTVVEAKGADHGFSQSYYTEEYLQWLEETITE